MVLETLESIVVGAEAFVMCIIVVINRPASPSMAFNAEMVVALHG